MPSKEELSPAPAEDDQDSGVGAEADTAWKSESVIADAGDDADQIEPGPEGPDPLGTTPIEEALTAPGPTDDADERAEAGEAPGPEPGIGAEVTEGAAPDEVTTTDSGASEHADAEDVPESAFQTDGYPPLEAALPPPTGIGAEPAAGATDDEAAPEAEVVPEAAPAKQPRTVRLRSVVIGIVALVVAGGLVAVGVAFDHFQPLADGSFMRVRGTTERPLPPFVDDQIFLRYKPGADFGLILSVRNDSALTVEVSQLGVTGGVLGGVPIKLTDVRIARKAGLTGNLRDPEVSFREFEPFTLNSGEEWAIYYQAHFFGCRTIARNSAFGYGYFPARIRLGPLEKGVQIPFPDITVERTAQTSC